MWLPSALWWNIKLCCPAKKSFSYHYGRLIYFHQRDSQKSSTQQDAWTLICSGTKLPLWYSVLQIFLLHPPTESWWVLKWQCWNHWPHATWCRQGQWGQGQGWRTWAEKNWECFCKLNRHGFCQFTPWYSCKEDADIVWLIHRRLIHPTKSLFKYS